MKMNVLFWLYFLPPTTILLYVSILVVRLLVEKLSKNNSKPELFAGIFIVLVVCNHIPFSFIEPYMDEPFHVNQTQAYCLYQFDKWDEKITTLPGLYVLAFILNIIPNTFLLPPHLICHFGFLRLVNLSIAVTLPIIFTACRSQVWFINVLIVKYF